MESLENKKNSHGVHENTALQAFFVVIYTVPEIHIWKWGRLISTNPAFETPLKNPTFYLVKEGLKWAYWEVDFLKETRFL